MSELKKVVIGAFCFFMLFALETRAAQITVNGPNGALDDTDGLCSISEAITNANDDAATYVNCAAGDGVDTIDIQQNITLSEQIDYDLNNGHTGTSAINTPMNIIGNGFELKRADELNCDINQVNEASEFRLLLNNSVLSIEYIKLINGCPDGAGNNASTVGGALLNKGELTISDLTFDQNRANSGGGLYNIGSGSTLEIKKSTFTGNTAFGGGGGITNRGLITLIENVTFSSNEAYVGGAIINSVNANINSINNTTFVNNIVTINATVISNQSSGLIHEISNSLFSNNTGGSFDCENQGGVINGSNNITDKASSFCPGTSSILSSNTVGPLADNGGPTMTHALLAGSEALNSAISGTENDQRGFAADGLRDIGAFEAQIPVVTAPEDISTISTGTMTSVDLGMASVVDADEPGLTAIPDNPGPFAVGMHEITWTAIDSYGHVGTDTQIVNILPNIQYDISITNPTLPEYTIIPYSIEYTSNPVGVTIENNGANFVNNVTLNREYLVDDVVVQSLSDSVAVNLQSGESTYINLGTLGFDESILGVVTANYEAIIDGIEDEVPENNAINNLFLLISDKNEMARDDQIATIATELIDEDGTQIGQLFTINNESTLESVVFIISNDMCDTNTGACSLDGLDITAKIYSADNITGRPIVQVVSTEPYTVPAGENSQIILNLPIEGGPLLLPAGNYVAVIDSPADPNPNDRLLPHLGLYFTDNRFTTGTTWYDIGGLQNWGNLEDLNFFKTPLIRLRFKDIDIIFNNGFE